MLEHQGLPVNDEALSSKRFYEDWDVPAPGVGVPQTGVFVFDPRQHSELLEFVYYSYEDKGPAELNYEMRPLAYELVKRGVAHWLDPRFNALWVYLRPLGEAPAPTLRRRAAKRLRLVRDPTEAELCTAAWRENYFLHFAGYAAQMRLLSGIDSSVEKKVYLAP